MNIELLEWAGSLTGLAGAALLALNSRVSRYGWVLFLASNCLLISFFLLGKHHGLLLMQCGFLMTSLLGIYRSFQASADDLALRLKPHDQHRYFSK